jgi:fluoroquinolone transport system permease protein
LRILSAIKSDIMFQVKQGFYTVYIILTIMYMILMSLLPTKISNIAVPLIVFSDPSVLGFFFIGGIVMLEKVQGVLLYILVTPLRTKEYLISKVLSLSLLAVAAGVAITFVSHKQNVNWILLILGIFLTSVFFTLFGFLVAAGCRTISQYFIKAIPYSLLLIIPCFSAVGFKYSWAFNIIPSVAGLKLVLSVFNIIPMAETIFCIALLVLANFIMLHYVERIFNIRIVYGGEV